jgi:hypothetical protein
MLAHIVQPHVCGARQCVNKLREGITMVQPQYYYDVRANMLTTFISTLVAILVAVPVAMFVATTLMKSQAASASTYSQNAQVGPAGSLVSAGNACVAPSSDSGGGEAGASASSQEASVWAAGGSGGGGGHTLPGRVAAAQFFSAIYQNQSEDNSTSYVLGSYNSNSSSQSTSVNATDSIVGDLTNVSDQENENFGDVENTTTTTTVTTTVTDNTDNSDNSIDDSFNNESVNQTAVGNPAINTN